MNYNENVSITIVGCGVCITFTPFVLKFQSTKALLAFVIVGNVLFFIGVAYTIYEIFFNKKRIVSKKKKNVWLVVLLILSALCVIFDVVHMYRTMGLNVKLKCKYI